MADTEYDVIIIGAGIGGLICGNYLSKSGMKVLIVEQNDKPGGCVTSINRKNYIFDMGGHLFGSCNKFGILGQCLANLDIDIDFIRISPTDLFHFPDMDVEVPISIDRYINNLQNMFPTEAESLTSFFREILLIAKKFVDPKILSKYQDVTYQNFLDSYFKNERLKGILSAQHLYIGTIPANASLMFMSVLLSSYLRDGVYYSKGGTQIFSDLLCKKFTEYGGTCILKNRVIKILLKKNKAMGIETDKGYKFLADIIVSNADATKTFYELIGEKNIPKPYLTKLKKYRRGATLFLTFFALKDFDRDISKFHGWHFSSYNMNDPDNFVLYVFIPTLFDSTIAPEKTHIVEAIIRFPYQFNEVSNWASCKAELQEKILSRLEEIMSPVISYIDYIDSASPKIMERFTLNSEGSIYGWEMSPEQIAHRRLQQETPIEDLFLTGHWTVPGCGITSVAVSGWQVAKKILKIKI